MVAVSPELPRLYLVSDRRLAVARGGLPAVLAEALSAIPNGAAMVQVREPDLEGRALLELTRAVVEVAHRRGCPVLVNDRADVARAAGADGVHLPERGLSPAEAREVWPEALIGASVHDALRARAAAEQGAAVIVFGPVWPTRGKPRGTGLDPLREVLRLAPVFAIGGIETAERAAQVRAAGAVGVACIRAVIGADDPGAAAAALHRALH